MPGMRRCPLGERRAQSAPRRLGGSLPSQAIVITEPPKRIRPARVSRYGLATHRDASNPTPRSACTFGSAVRGCEVLAWMADPPG
jgi:hypothetical protein